MRIASRWVPWVMVAWVAVVLLADVDAGIWRQRGLGAVTWGLLLVLLRGQSRLTQLQVWVVVAYASLVEYTMAGWLGVYSYRLGNVPSFVPPGHGLVYLAALALGGSELFRRHQRGLVVGVLLVDGAWALWGLLVSPRSDVLGALWFACLAVFLLRGRAPLVYVGAFLVTSYLEIVGTSLGTWAWGRQDPFGLVTIGNPPSGIAGGYCWFDAAALTLAPVLLRLLARQQAQRGVVQLPVAAHDAPAA